MAIKRTDKDLVPDTLDSLEADGENSSIATRVRDINALQLTGRRRKVQTEDALNELAELNSSHDGTGLLAWMSLLPKPAEAGFNLGLYAKDARYKEYRDMDARDREISSHYSGGKYTGNAGRGPGSHINPLTAAAGAAIAIGTVGAVTIGERQREFYKNMDNVHAVTGAPVKLMGAMWGIESSFSKNQTSITGCQGPAQFTRGTFAAMIRQYGDQIPGMEQYAVGLRNGTIKPRDEGLQAMRNDQKVAGYAMGFYLQELARDMKVDINDPQNWGKLYAAYNVGPGNAKILARSEGTNVNAAALIGDAAKWNPAFFVNGATPAQAQKNYQTAIANGIQSFDKRIVAKFDQSGPEPISVASAVAGPAITAVAKPKAEFSDAKTEAKAKEQADAVVKTAQHEQTLFERMKTKLYGYAGLDDDPKPAPKLAEAKPKVELVPHVYG